MSLGFEMANFKNLLAIDATPDRVAFFILLLHNSSNVLERFLLRVLVPPRNCCSYELRPKNQPGTTKNLKFL